MIEKGNCIFIGGKTFVVTYQESDFFSNDSHNLVLYLRNLEKKTPIIQLFLVSCVVKSMGYKYTWGNSISLKKIQDDKIMLPITNFGAIDFDFMESFICELEEERIRELSAYLTASGLDNCKLSKEEKAVLDDLEKKNWKLFNLETLFGPSTRGKRLKSDDRILGSLPFVTAGEADEGVSAFIGNKVQVFSENTTTIDMFGSAKYRNYAYGADDHVAVVHTESLSKYAAVFVTTSCHKAAHTGKFNYSNNFYAKDADALFIMLPVTSVGTPDYVSMDLYMRAVQKLVVRNVSDYLSGRIIF